MYGWNNNYKIKFESFIEYAEVPVVVGLKYNTLTTSKLIGLYF